MAFAGPVRLCLDGSCVRDRRVLPAIECETMTDTASRRDAHMNASEPVIP